MNLLIYNHSLCKLKIRLQKKNYFHQIFISKAQKELIVPELQHVMDELKTKEDSKYNKGRRLWKRHKLMFEQELGKRLKE